MMVAQGMMRMTMMMTIQILFMVQTRRKMVRMIRMIPLLMSIIPMVMN